MMRKIKCTILKDQPEIYNCSNFKIVYYHDYPLTVIKPPIQGNPNIMRHVLLYGLLDTRFGKIFKIYISTKDVSSQPTTSFSNHHRSEMLRPTSTKSLI